MTTLLHNSLRSFRRSHRILPYPQEDVCMHFLYDAVLKTADKIQRDGHNLYNMTVSEADLFDETFVYISTLRPKLIDEITIAELNADADGIEAAEYSLKAEDNRALRNIINLRHIIFNVC